VTVENCGNSEKKSFLVLKKQGLKNYIFTLGLVKTKNTSYKKQNMDIIERKICWRVTRYCTLHCMHCLAGHGTKLIKDLSEDDQLLSVKKIIKCNVSRITWTGGEPTLCATLPQLLKICHDNNIKSIITTHGLALREKFYSALNKELDKLRFSFDGLEKKHNLIRGGQYFEKTLDTMKRSFSLGFTIEANINVMQNNIKEIPDLICKLESIGIKKIVLLNLMDRESAHDNNLERPQKEEYVLLNKKLVELKYLYPNLEIQLNNYWDENDYYIVLESNGEIFLCSENTEDKSFGFITENAGIENLNLALINQTLSHRKNIN